MTDKIQALMDQAYDRWQANRGMSQQDFWDGLDAMERLAVFCGNFNYQVGNGGLTQWHGNGYATPETVGYITRICENRMKTPVALEVARIIREFMQINPDTVDDDDYEDYWIGTSALDGQYYAIMDQWLAELEALVTAVETASNTAWQASGLTDPDAR